MNPPTALEANMMATHDAADDMIDDGKASKAYCAAKDRFARECQRFKLEAEHEQQRQKYAAAKAALAAAKPTRKQPASA